MKKDFFTIIQEGEHKGKRLYFEDKCGGDSVILIELLYLFKNALKNNYKIFLLNCKPNHNIIIPENDLNFIKTSIKQEDQNIYKNHIFSEEVLNLKQLQYKDLLKLYNLSIKHNNVGALFLYPFLNNNFYCFNVFLIVNQEFDLNSVINSQYNVIKINSITQYYESTITLNILTNIYNFSNLQFKDYIVTSEELEKTRPYNIFDLPEKIEYDDFLKSFSKYIKNNPKKDFSKFNEKNNMLQNKLWKKETKLWDINLYKKLCFSKFCFHFYIFNENIMNDTVFFTNFNQLLNDLNSNIFENHIKSNYNNLHYYSLIDLFTNDNYRLFSIFLSIYQWKKK